MQQRQDSWSGPYRRLAGVFFFGVMAAYAAVILAAKNPPPFVDYPDWVYQGVLFHGVLTGHPVAGYVMKSYPVPNSLTTVGLGLLDTVLPWQWSGKIWIALYLALAAGTMWWATHVLRVNSRALFAIPAIVILNLNFWYGHISFEIGLCLTVLLACMLVRGWHVPWIAAMLVLLFFTHMEACAAALLLLALWCALHRRLPMLWSALPAAGLTVWYAAARFMGGNADARSVPSADYRYLSKPFLVYKVNTFAKTFGYVNAVAQSGLSESERVLGKGLFVAMIAISLIMAGLCLFAIVRVSLRQGGQWNKKTFEIFALILLGISALLPQIFLGVADPGSRLILIAAAMGILLIDWRGRAGMAIACLGVVFSIVNLWQFAQISRAPRMEGHAANIPAAMLHYGHVEPGTRLQYYDHLEQGQMDMDIFSTAMFLRTTR